MHIFLAAIWLALYFALAVPAAIFVGKFIKRGSGE